MLHYYYVRLTKDLPLNITPVTRICNLKPNLLLVMINSIYIHEWHERNKPEQWLYTLIQWYQVSLGLDAPLE